MTITTIVDGIWGVWDVYPDTLRAVEVTLISEARMIKFKSKPHLDEWVEKGGKLCAEEPLTLPDSASIVNTV